MCGDDGIGCDDQRGLAFGRVVDFGFVDCAAFLLGRCEDVFEGAEAMREVLGEGAGDYLEGGEADLGWGTLSL